jgi:hypothetical protein
VLSWQVTAAAPRKPYRRCTICSHSSIGAPTASPSSITPGVVDQDVEALSRKLTKNREFLLDCDIATHQPRIPISGS